MAGTRREGGGQREMSGLCVGPGGENWGGGGEGKWGLDDIGLWLGLGGRNGLGGWGDGR